MLFNSIEFAIFLPISFLIYWFITNSNLKFQNTFLVIISYLFYGWWDWRFLTLIFFSTCVDYFIGILLSNAKKHYQKSIYLWISIIVNLGFLGFFKYFNFFSDSFSKAFTLFGSPLDTTRLDIVLPVGISFYTFQTMSYSIDIYKEKLTPTKDFIAFSAFVCFFPQLVAGPIERASNLLPQFYKKRNFEYNKAVDGLRQILWGLFKKIVIADNCADFANIVFDNSSEMYGSTLALGAIFFSFQIYCDFSGYSDIAIGTSRLFGFDLQQNFNFPYFSRNIAEFWRRWHISLNTWFQDYLYIPLGGSRGGTLLKTRNIFIIFIVSGLWHGANWTFVAWGFVNAILFLPLMLNNKNHKHEGIVAQGKIFPTIIDFFRMVTTFTIVVFTWIFFRSTSLSQAFDIIDVICSKTLFIPKGSDFVTSFIHPYKLLILLSIFIIIEWYGREGQYAIEKIFLNTSSIYRYIFYITITVSIFWFRSQEQQFIYFQF